MNELQTENGLLESNGAPSMAAAPYGLEEIANPAGLPRPLAFGGEPIKAAHHGASTPDVDGIRCEFMAVTPEMATEWLQRNLKNRKLRDEVVKSYARDMVGGDWLVTHQGVAFNDKGELIDGQHRLSAVIAAGVPVMLLVTFGLPSQLLGKRVTTMDAVDRGAMRTIGDQLTLQHNMRESNLITGICAAIARLCMDIRIRKLTVAQVLGVFDVYKESITFVVENRSKASGLRTAGVLGALAFAHAVEAERVTPLFVGLNSGENLMRESAILQLRNFLISSNTLRFQSSVRTRVPEVTLYALYSALMHKPVRFLRTDRTSSEGLKFFRDRQKESVERVAAIFQLPRPN